MTILPFRVSCTNKRLRRDFILSFYTAEYIRPPFRIKRIITYVVFFSVSLEAPCPNNRRYAYNQEIKPTEPITLTCMPVFVFDCRFVVRIAHKYEIAKRY